MTHALTLTLPLKQDAETQAKLKHLDEIFTKDVQPKIDAALKNSKIVHFARVVVINASHIQVITEYDGDHWEYSEFFRRELTPVFAAIFDLAEDAPPVTDENAFWKYAKKYNYRSLGTSTSGSTDFNGHPAGYLFSAYGAMTVKEVLARLEQPATA